MNKIATAIHKKHKKSIYKDTEWFPKETL